MREKIYGAIFDDLLSAIKGDDSKHAALLRKVRGEARMSIDAYRMVFDGSIAFGASKLSQAVRVKGDLEERRSLLEQHISATKTEVQRLKELCEGLEHRADQKEKAYEIRDNEVIDLTAEKQQLDDLLKTLRLSKPEKDAKN